MVTKRYLNIICVALLITASFAFGYKYTREPMNEGDEEYLIHRFRFDGEEIEQIASSYGKAQGYAQGMIDCVWDMSEGLPGSDVGKFIGRVYLGDWLYRAANEFKDANDDEMLVQIRSSIDEDEKKKLELLDWIAGVWKALAGF